MLFMFVLLKSLKKNPNSTKNYYYFSPMNQNQNQKPDLFGFETQQANYDLYRQEYPEEYYEQILKKVPSSSRQNYLDLGTGTGMVLFKLSKYFSKISLGIDKSLKQLETAKNKLTNESNNNIVFELMDVKDLTGYMKERALPCFDLITIGEALHWFDVPQTLKSIREEWLIKNGVLAVLGYICKGFVYNTQDKTKESLGFKVYEKMMESVGPYFECDRIELDQAYPTYPFGKFFENIDRREDIVQKEISVQELIRYVRTFSAYNTYLADNSKKEGFIDALEVMEKQIKEDLKAFGGDICNLEKPLKLVKKFFLIISQ